MKKKFTERIQAATAGVGFTLILIGGSVVDAPAVTTVLVAAGVAALGLLALTEWAADRYL